MNDNLVLIVGESSSGKSASLLNLENPSGVVYANCEAGKKLPFKSGFKQVIVTDPITHMQGIFDQAEQMPEVHTIVVDTLTYLMDMYESIYVLNASNGMKAWGDYAQFFKNLMQDLVAKSTKNVIFLAHTKAEFNDAQGIFERSVPIKGSLKNNGIESYFSSVVSTKKMTIADLDKYSSPLLTFTDDDLSVGYKHVFQTRVTKQTVGERIRSPLGMWSVAETYINNDTQLILNRLGEYYSD